MSRFTYIDQKDCDQSIVVLRALALAHAQGVLDVSVPTVTSKSDQAPRLVANALERCHSRGLVTAKSKADQPGFLYYRLVDHVVYPYHGTTQQKPCDVCGAEAVGDFKTAMGPWGYLCNKHLFELGVGIGEGYGQVFVKVGD